ncbi:MAG: hypothetical protein E7202_03435 [Selenomonas ruminantium]|nr:hypothetical protein [Selenomonas ruminantium]
MKIDDSLRNEVMPEMVYSLCRLVASRRLSQKEIVRALALGADNEKKIRDSVNKVFNFAQKSGMIRKNEESEIWECLFRDDELLSFRSFRHALFMKAAPNENVRFGKIVQWYLSQDPELLRIEKAEALIQNLPEDILMKDAQNARGFIIWACALGVMQRGYAGAKNRAMNIYPKIDGCISDWLYYEKPFQKGERVLVRDFMQQMRSDCPLLKDTFAGNDINRVLSNALRILDGTGWIRLRYTKDSGDVWHLTRSITRQMTNDVTEIEVLR